MIGWLKNISYQIVALIVLPIFTGLVVYWWTDKEKEPTLFTEEIKTIIVDGENIGDAPVTVVRKGGKLINKSIVSSTFYFFNRGEQTITDEDIYSPPLRFRLSDSTDQILGIRILRLSRPEAGIKVTLDSVRNAIDVTFFALESGDGFTCQVIYDGSSASEVVPVVGINGVKEYYHDVRGIRYFVVITVLLMIPLVIGFQFISDRLRKLQMRFWKKFVLFLTCLIVFWGGFMYAQIVLSSKNPRSGIPKELRISE